MPMHDPMCTYVYMIMEIEAVNVDNGGVLIRCKSWIISSACLQSIVP